MGGKPTKQTGLLAAGPVRLPGVASVVTVVSAASKMFVPGALGVRSGMTETNGAQDQCSNAPPHGVCLHLPTFRNPVIASYVSSGIGKAPSQLAKWSHGIETLLGILVPSDMKGIPSGARSFKTAGSSRFLKCCVDG